jgi:hypothetical protein
MIPTLAQNWSIPSVIGDTAVFIKIDLTAEMPTKSVRIACVNILNVAQLEE